MARGRKKQHISSKGAAWERNICGRLSLWMSQMRRKDLFWRSAMSGGRATIDKSSHAMAGDICAIHKLGARFLELFTIECKWRATFNVEASFFGREGFLLRDWYQAYDQVAPGREPLLMMKQNFKVELVGTTAKGIEMLEHGGKIDLWVVFPGEDLYLFPLDSFLELSWGKIKRANDPLKRERL